MEVDNDLDDTCKHHIVLLPCIPTDECFCRQSGIQGPAKEWERGRGRHNFRHNIRGLQIRDCGRYGHICEQVEHRLYAIYVGFEGAADLTLEGIPSRWPV